MKKYILNEDSKVNNKSGETVIPKGTKLSSDGYIDEYGGIKGKVTNGNFKGMEIIFNIRELLEIN